MIDTIIAFLNKFLVSYFFIIYLTKLTQKFFFFIIFIEASNAPTPGSIQILDFAIFLGESVISG